jgi:ribosomal subunit interface protein
MNLQITGDRIHLTPTIKTLIDEKINQRIGKLLTHFSPDIQIAGIRIQKEKLGLFKVNFDMTLPGQTHVYAETEHILLESALVDLSHQVEKQIKKYCHRS